MLLTEGKPMTNYKNLRPLYEFLKLKSTPNKHYNDSLGWEIVEHLHNQILSTIKIAIWGAKFVALTCDEVITLDNHSWIYVHGYYVQDWCCIPILLVVDHVVEGSNAQDLTKVITDILVSINGLTKAEVPKKLLCFGVDGVSTF
jgi:hypothetical protein